MKLVQAGVAAVAAAVCVFVGGPVDAAPAPASIDVSVSAPVVAPGTEVVLRGTVRDAAGKAVPGADVKLGVEDGVSMQSRMVPVDSAGAFEYRVTPRTSAFYLVRFIAGKARTDVSLAATATRPGIRAVTRPIALGVAAPGQTSPLTSATLYRSAGGTSGTVSDEIGSFAGEIWDASVKENTKPDALVVYAGTGFVCAISAVAPVAAPACAAGVTLSITKFKTAEAVALAKVIVGRLARDEQERNRLVAAVDAGKVLFSVFSAGESANNVLEVMKTVAAALAAGEAVSRVVTGRAADTKTQVVSIVKAGANAMELVVSVAK